MKSKCVKLLVLPLLCFLIIYQFSCATYAEEEEKDENRFNVMVLLDNSNSMNYTDPDKNRMEAIGLFINLLTKNGNTIGDVVFSDGIDSYQDIIPADGQAVKDAFLDTLENNNPSGYTNTGLGLDMAVNNLIEQGKTNLNSVILYLSDGNTEMPDEKSFDESITLKENAIQKAREHGIKIYCVCLNANQDADVTEMRQISEATNGIFQEVQNVDDLKEVFNQFYTIVFGLDTILLAEDKFNKNGELEKDFSTPSFGVEEVNIIIYGNVDDVKVTNPEGEPVDVITNKSKTYTMVKFDNIEGGDWHLKALGNPESEVKVNMVFNTNLSLDLNSNYDEFDSGLTEQDNLILYAKMKSGNEVADKDYQYEGYSAELICMNSSREELPEYSTKMTIDNGCFSCSMKLKEGIYYFKAKLSGNYINKESKEIGAIQIIKENSPDPEPKPAIETNEPPCPVENPVNKKKCIIPFKDNSLIIPLNELATDDHDSSLTYKLQSSSFIPEKDYDINDNEIIIHHYSLRKGAFTVRAYDSLGEYCDIEIIVKSIRVEMIVVIGVIIVGLIILVISLIVLYRLLIIPFRGTIQIVSYYNGKEDKDVVNKKRGVAKIGLFNNMTAFNLKWNSRFQASGKEYVDFYVKPKVFFNGQVPVNVYQIIDNENGFVFTLKQIGPEEDIKDVDRFVVYFESDLKSRVQKPIVFKDPFEKEEKPDLSVDEMDKENNEENDDMDFLNDLDQ